MGLGSFIRRISSYDAFAKPFEDYRTRTIFGGLVTILSFIFVFFLILIEYGEYRKIEWKPEFVVDKSRKEKMDIYFNITFPKIPCFTVSVDVMDAAGEHQMNIEKSVKKLRLDPSGNIIDESYHTAPHPTDVSAKNSLSVATAKTEFPKKSNYCGSCYAATAIQFDGSLSCCNTCDDVKEAYKKKNLPLPELEMIEQCMNEEDKKNLESQKVEGCSIGGNLRVNRIPGNFHIAPGYSFQLNSVHLHDLRAFPDMSFKFDHYIRYMEFGEYHPNLVLPLNGVNVTADGDEVFNYFIKVVSTEFQYLNGTTLNTNQYSVTKHRRTVPSESGGFTGVFFNLEISPMVVIYRETRPSLSSFLTQICAIVGGVYTLASIFDSFLYAAEKRYLHKLNMGKAT